RLASICPLISPYDGHHGPLHSFPTRRSSDLVGRRLPWHEPGTTTETRDGAHEALAEETAHEDDHRGEHEQVAHADFTQRLGGHLDRKSTRLNSSHVSNSYAVFCLKKKIKNPH